MRFGGIKQLDNGKWEYDIPSPNIYKCEECGSRVVEHIWIGYGHRSHIQLYCGEMLMGEISGEITCNISDCEFNHRKHCNGNLILIQQGHDSKFQSEMDHKIKKMTLEVL